MSSIYRPWPVDEPQFLPASVHDYVPPDHAAHFVRDLVRETLDLSAIHAAHSGVHGQPPFDPRMMVALLIYCYSQGVYSSRRIARACEERLDVMAITAGETPNFRTINLFRLRHLAALAALFRQVLELCRKAGLVSLGHVALDGTKVRANASKRKAMSYGRMKEKEPELAAVVDGWLAAAQAADAAEEAATPGRRGDEMPKWVADKTARLEKIREAKAALEAEAASAAKAKGRDDDDPPPRPDDKTQRNFTDPESRIMRAGGGFEQAYNAQAAVDADHQIVVACEVGASGVDVARLVPMLEAMAASGVVPRQLSADAGYCSEANLAALEERGVDDYVAAGRQRHGTAAPGEGGTSKRPLTEAMRKKLRDGGFEGPCRKRKIAVEPVFGQIKEARGFRRFLMRGLAKVQLEWSFLCAVHNVLKPQRARPAFASA